MVEGVKRSDGQDGQKEGGGGLGRPKGGRVQKGEVVMEEAEIGGQVAVQARAAGESKGIGQGIFGILGANPFLEPMTVRLGHELRWSSGGRMADGRGRARRRIGAGG